MERPTPIERIGLPPGDEFVARYVRKSRPVILAGAARDWPALKSWMPDELARRFSDRVVPVLRTRSDGGFYNAEGGMNYDRMSMGEYVDALHARRRELYMVFHIQEALPELLEDVHVPELCRRAAWFWPRFWFGMGGTGGPLHADLPHNLYMQAVGRKQFTLVHYHQTARVYPFPPWSGIPNFSQVDAEEPDLDRFPRFARATRQVAELEPGDMLYIPSLYWHQPRALTDSVSINLWWANGALREVVRAAEWFMRKRQLKL